MDKIQPWDEKEKLPSILIYCLLIVFISSIKYHELGYGYRKLNGFTYVKVQLIF